MLDEAEFTIMGFIKGPVCRGNIALNVIEDRFWVMFLKPELHEKSGLDDFLAKQFTNLKLPAAESSNTKILPTLLKYSYKQKKFLDAKQEYLEKTLLKENKTIPFNLVWDGNGKNTNAALTIFRHTDAATVVRGFIGEPPQTAWLIGYPLLERIHYLLVAGFDLYGNVGHQFNSRVYMEFLRREGEQNFLHFLSDESRKFEQKRWYHETKELVNNKVSKGP